MGSDGLARSGSSTPGDGGRAFLITVDTEGDNLWAKPRDITTRNAETLPKFHELCERYGLRPTYLVNWEMATAPAFIEFGRAVLAQGSGEIGMHLHAWNSPPIVPLTDDDYRYQPYLMEYPEDLLREKVKVMTDTLEQTFGVKMVSHRAGRWGLDETYARALIDAGYRVDCSVTPNRDWRSTLGDPAGSGGPDYRDFPGFAYFVDPNDISRPGSSPLLEVPLTVLRLHESPWARAARASAGRVPYLRRLVYRSWPALSWLQPVRNTGRTLTQILSAARQQGSDYVEFVVHSSELMAGGSPWFATQRDIDRTYQDLEELFDASTYGWSGMTLGAYHDSIIARER